MSKIFALVGIITMGVGIAMMFNAGMQPNASAQSDTDGTLAMGSLILIHEVCFERVPSGDDVSPGVIRLAGRDESVCGFNPTPTPTWTPHPTATPVPTPEAHCIDAWTGEPWGESVHPEHGYTGGEITCGNVCEQWVDLTQPGDIWQHWEWVVWEPGAYEVSDDQPVYCYPEE